MKIIYFLFALAAISLTACSTTGQQQHGSAKSDPETVLVTYHVTSGKEAELQALLSRVWQVYRTEHLVSAEPHIIVRATEGGDKIRFVEIFTWVGHDASVHAPAAVQTLWRQEHSLCEARDGHEGIEGGEVKILIGK